MHKAIAGILGIAVIAVAASKFSSNSDQNAVPDSNEVGVVKEAAATLGGTESETRVFTGSNGVAVVQDSEKESTSFKPPRKPRSSGLPESIDPSTMTEKQLEKFRADRIKDAIMKRREVETGEKISAGVNKDKPEDMEMQPSKEQAKEQNKKIAMDEDKEVEKTEKPKTLTDVTVEATPIAPRSVIPGEVLPSAESVVQGYNFESQVIQQPHIWIQESPQTTYLVPEQQHVYQEVHVQSSYGNLDAPPQGCGKRGCGLGIYGRMSAEQLWQGYNRGRDW